jgi:glycosyltransferase involved in cell wall biosynthesis
MKLLFAIKSLDVPGGGAERVLAIVASGLAARGHDVSVLTFDPPGGRSFYALDASVRRISLGIGPTAGRSGPRAFLERLPALRRTVRGESPDAAIGFMHSMFVPLAFSLLGSGIPLVASEHIVPEYYKGRRTEWTLFVLGCLLSKRVTVLSEAVKQLYPPGLRRRMVPMPNPVVVYDDCTVDPVGADKPRRTVLSVGRLEAQKDHETLVEAFALVADRFPDWELRIVGDGSLRGSLEATISARGLAGRVSLSRPTDRIDAEYGRAQLVAVPSRFESFGMVTAEALAVGLPVLGFADCPGTNELVRHNQNGWLVEVPDGGRRTTSYAEGLSKLMGDAGLRQRLGEAAGRESKAFDPRTVVGKWERLLADVTGGSS